VSGAYTHAGRYMATRLEARFIETRTPPVEAHRPVVTYLQFPIQVCFPCNDHAQPAADKATIKGAHFRHRQPCEINGSVDV